MIPKEKTKKFEEDKAGDVALINEVVTKYKDAEEFAAKLTVYLSQKYGSDFGGKLKISYDVVDKAFTLDCGFDTATFEKVDAEELAAQLKLFREQAFLRRAEKRK